MSKKTILVVGGAGFIGSHVNKVLHQHDYNTVVFDNLSTGCREAIVRGDFFKGDLANIEDIEEVFRSFSIDAVMHFAAKIDVGESVRKPDMYYRNNVVNTLNLLEVMRKFGVVHFLFSSSAAVYGVPEVIPIPETHLCRPINPYGETKLIVEKMSQDFDTAYGVKTCSLRYFNAAGGDPEGEIKNYKKKETNLIPIVLRNILQGNNEAAVFGNDYPTPDGTCLRDYIHVYDLAQGHLMAMEKLVKDQESAIYNLGNSRGFSVLEVIHAIENVTGVKLTIRIHSRRPGDPPVLIADAKKAERELGWKPLYPFLDKMISDAWRAVT